MSHTQTMPERLGHSSIYEDPELTPKPLRVIKRGNPTKSKCPETSPALTASSGQRTLVPTRSSSISSGSALKPFSPLDLSSATALSSGRRTSLHMRKQRRSDPIYNFNTALNSTSAIHDCRKRLLYARPMDGMTDRPTARRSSWDIPPIYSTKSTGSRAFTTGAINTTSHLPSLTAAELTVTGARRASTAVTDNRLGLATEHADGPVLRRNPSFRHRFFTRVRGSLSHRSHMGYTTINAPSKDTPNLERNSNFDGQVIKAMAPSNRTSASSEETDTFESTILSFPTPPTSHGGSPTILGSFSSSQLEPQHYRELCKPEETAIMGAALHLTAEYDEANAEDGSSMLVAIDIEGTIKNTSSDQGVRSQHTGLDVAVVIDNSLRFYTSPDMLMASCETTRALASILSVATDRMAILCTSPINGHRTLGADFTKIWPLSRIKPQKIKTVLDAVANKQEIPSTGSWEKAIQRATEVLLQSPVSEADAEVLHDTFGLVVILTANAEGLHSSLLTHDRIQFHVMCPASVPRNSFGDVDCNGWKVQFMSGNEPWTARAQKDSGSSGMLEKLSDLVVHARSGMDAGKLTDLCLDIKASPKCRIDNVMGESEYLTLHPGELRTILVRLRVPPSDTQPSPLFRSASIPALGQYSDDIEDELDKMLRLAPKPVKILSAKLKYKQSILTPNTTCSVVADCSLKRRVSAAPREIQAEPLSPKRVVKMKMTVHERLARHLATQGPPATALSTFRHEFGEEGWHSYCPDYTHLVLGELKYQARITERLEIDSSPKKLMPPVQLSRSLSSDDPSQDIFADENTKLISGYPKIADGDMVNLRGVQLATLADLRKATKPVSEMHAELEQARILAEESRRRNEASSDLRRRRAVTNGGVPRMGGLKAAALKRITSAGESLAKGLGGT